MKESADSIIETLKLAPHEEGGWFRRTYQCDMIIQSPSGIRPCGTSILYLLEKGKVSKLHSLVSDETWYFHQGNPLELHLFGPSQYECFRLGHGLKDGHLPQLTIPSGTIFCAESEGPGEWSLVSCSVSPGFDYSDLCWVNLEELVREYPEQESLIRRTSYAQ